MSEAVAYLRVSTDRQGRSGLGLEAQREAIGRFARDQGLDLVEERVEVEGGKGQTLWSSGRNSGVRSTSPAGASAPSWSPNLIGCRATFISSVG